MEFLLAVLGLALGTLLGYLWGRARAGAETAAAREALATRSAELEAARQGAAEREAFLARAREDLENAFGNLAAKALNANNEAFLAHAEERLEAKNKQSTGEFKKDKEAIENRLKEMGEALVTVRGQHKSLDDNLKSFGAVVSDLGRESHALSTALRGSSQARGNWGELHLRNLIEIAGMSEHCDFVEQRGTGELRPDMVVRLSGGDGIPIDAKAPLAAYLAGLEAADPAAQRELFKKHATELKKHVRDLEKREYHGGTAIAGSIDFTVLYLPGEPILAAALQYDRELQEYALSRRILLATPVTLFALLKTVGIYWRQQAVAENAEKVFEVARVFYDRVRVFADHLGKVGRGLDLAVTSYNRAVGSFDQMVIPQGRRIEGLKAIESAKTLVAPASVEAAVRNAAPRVADAAALTESEGEGDGAAGGTL